MRLTGLKRAREAKGWTQERLSVEMGVHQITVTRWELGDRDPSTDTLRRLSDILGVTVDSLLRPDPAQPVPAEVEQPVERVQS